MPANVFLSRLNPSYFLPQSLFIPSLISSRLSPIGKGFFSRIDPREYESILYVRLISSLQRLNSFLSRHEIIDG